MAIELWSPPRVAQELATDRPVNASRIGLRNAVRSLFPPPDGYLGADGVPGWAPGRVGLIRDWYGDVVLPNDTTRSVSYLTTTQLARRLNVSADRLQKWYERYRTGTAPFPPPAVELVWPRKEPTAGWAAAQVVKIHEWSLMYTRDDHLERGPMLTDAELVRQRQQGVSWRDLGRRAGVTHSAVRARYNKLTGQG